MTTKVAYTTSATSTGGREGHSRVDDGSLELDLTTPEELGGNGKPGANPEKLFAMGYSGCFLGAMKFVASKGGPKVPENAQVKAVVGMGPRDEGGFGIEVELRITLPGLSFEDAISLVETAHQVCPYSNALRGNVEVKLSVIEGTV